MKSDEKEYRQKKKEFERREIVIEENVSTPTPPPDIPKADKKVVKYFKARKKGKSRAEAQIEAGYKDTAHGSRIEKTNAYKKVEKYFNEILLDHISFDEIAETTSRNIRQDKNLNASNKAVEIALSHLSPLESDRDDDRLVVVLSQGKVTDIKATGEEVKEN
jgi:hypothetical protein